MQRLRGRQKIGKIGECQLPEDSLDSTSDTNKASLMRQLGQEIMRSVYSKKANMAQLLNRCRRAVLTCYGTKIVLQWLKEGKLVINKISQLGPMDPSTNSRSPDLTVCDFFLWGYLKMKVFGGNPLRTIPALKQRIQEEVAAIPVNMLRGVRGQTQRMMHSSVREACSRSLIARHDGLAHRQQHSQA
ncbi:hypothetical protein ANN_14021 [Periplaneta americana]|uniref:Uncharacterized protein n=1 Tax=Periplaneta americana TaxID=6978 RepID=A0ABQ8SWM4_PERAM|nr:hypothetical protein ANN_14021 [Periplaneta americana]